MSIHFAGSAKTRTVSLLKQITSPVEWSAGKSKDVIRQYYHWLELISKYEAISLEKISDTVKITLALQNVKGNLAQSLNVSISDSTTWLRSRATDQLLQQCSPCRPHAYLSVRPVREDRDQLVQERQRQRSKIKRTERKRIKGVLVTSESQRKVKKQRKDQVKRQRSMDYLVMGSKSAECQLGSRSERSKRVKERQRKISLLNLWKIRTCFKSDFSVGGVEIKKDGILKDQHSSAREVQVHSTQRKFTIFISTLRISPFRLYLQINSEVFMTYDLKLNNSSIRIWVKRQLNAVRLRLFFLAQTKVDSVVKDSTSTLFLSQVI